VNMWFQSLSDATQFFLFSAAQWFIFHKV
jgi:hypothetical protein